MGQARKSLWIETRYLSSSLILLLMVRLVRACGSKLCEKMYIFRRHIGQARKSLWIETCFPEVITGFAHWSGS